MFPLRGWALSSNFVVGVKLGENYQSFVVQSSSLSMSRMMNIKKLIFIARSSHPEVFLAKGVLKIFSKFTGEHRCRIGITLLHGCSPVNLLHIFRTPFHRNTSGWLHLFIAQVHDPTTWFFFLLKFLAQAHDFSFMLKKM